jgi:molybdopterin-guanine dinucleotide biosynthesis protein A
VRILDALVSTFREALGSDPILIANDPDAANWYPGLQVARDIRQGAGALGGLHTAVVEGPAPVVCVAWDMPFVPAGFIAHLAAQLERWDAVLPASRGRRGMEPLCAAYGPACRVPMEEALDRGDLRAIAFHDAVKTCILPLEGVAGFGDPAAMFFNVNTKDDLKRADELWRQRGSSR